MLQKPAAVKTPRWRASVGPRPAGGKLAAVPTGGGRWTLKRTARRSRPPRGRIIQNGWRRGNARSEAGEMKTGAAKPISRKLLARE